MRINLARPLFEPLEIFFMLDVLISIFSWKIPIRQILEVDENPCEENATLCSADIGQVINRDYTET